MINKLLEPFVLRGRANHRLRWLKEHVSMCVRKMQLAILSVLIAAICLSDYFSLLFVKNIYKKKKDIERMLVNNGTTYW